MAEQQQTNELPRPNTAHMIPKPVRWFLQGLSLVAPPLAVPIAKRLWCTPMRADVKPVEQKVMDSADPFELEIEGNTIACWSWGAGPAVLLLHGWGSRGSRMTDFVEPLIDAGFRVVSFDAPAHGDSTGRTTTGIYYSRALLKVAAHIGGPHAIVAHSMGGWVASLAFRQGLRADRAVFISSPDDMKYYSILFAEQTGFSMKVQEKAERRLEIETGVEWSQLSADNVYGGHDFPLLVIHDRDDPVSALEQGENVHRAWKGSELIVTEGLGHRRIITDPAVISRAVAFLT
jgi:pimeloyl-ACP methyl ester carboxylesterase